MKSDTKQQLSKTNELIYSGALADIKKILEQARNYAYSAVNSAMVKAYWLIGRRIVEEEQQGEARAEYGAHLIVTIAKEPTDEFGNGFSVQSLKKLPPILSDVPGFANWLRAVEPIRREKLHTVEPIELVTLQGDHESPQPGQAAVLHA